MNQGTWGSDGPPPEAYSRLTNPERFAPLHGFAQDLVARLASEYDVERLESYELEPTLRLDQLARPSIKLAPRSLLAASIQISFTTFPGLVVRAGRWYSDRLPACGCDACDETAESVVADLSFVIENVIRGPFSEELALPPLVGPAWRLARIGDRAGGGSSESRTRIDRADAREMLRSSRKSYDWAAWQKR